MKQMRLLPVVIAAGAALLLLKSLGIMTGGGYVLTGPARAQDAATSNTTLALPVEPTLNDEQPTLDDEAPTLETGNGMQDHSAPPEETAAPGDAEEAEAEAVEGEAAVQQAEAEPIPDLSGSLEAVEAGCPESEAGESVIFANPDGGCLPPLDEAGDAVPMVRGAEGTPIPLESADESAGSEDEVLERLAERREALEAREIEIEMRMALVEAAEKRITERTAALEVLEARINAMVDEKRVLEEAHFTALVAMYETMRPKDAAAIFDELQPNVLLRVARAINPRKMGPIMAKMNPMKAKDLTADLAVDQVEPTIDLASEDLSSLPQIVGQ